MIDLIVIGILVIGIIIVMILIIETNFNSEKLALKLLY